TDTIWATGIPIRPFLADSQPGTPARASCIARWIVPPRRKSHGQRGTTYDAADAPDAQTIRELYSGMAQIHSQTGIFTGGCHCGAVRYRVEIDLSKPVTQCNCSICGRTGTLLSFVPASAFTLEKGEDSLTDYQFNRKRIHHVF